MAGEAVRAVLNHVWTSLESLGIPRALMGGVALAVWNHPRATRDVDLLIGVDRSSVQSVIDQLQSHGCRPKRTPPLLEVGSHSFLQFLYSPPGEFYDVQFDLLLAESDLEKSAITRRITYSLPGIGSSIDVLRCDDLILLKLNAGRTIDRADAAMLLRENQDTIDMDYLASWVVRLGLEAEFAEVWREALPGSDPPVPSTC